MNVYIILFTHEATQEIAMENRKARDGKLKALAEHGAFNRRYARVTDELFQAHEFFDARDLVQVKYEMLRRTGQDGWSVRQAAMAFGFSRPSYYQAQEAFDAGGLTGLISKRRGPRAAHKLTEKVVAFLARVRGEDGSLRGMELAQRVQEEFGIRVHPRSIERALARRSKKRKRARG